MEKGKLSDQNSIYETRDTRPGLPDPHLHVSLLRRSLKPLSPQFFIPSLCNHDVQHPASDQEVEQREAAAATDASTQDI